MTDIKLSNHECPNNSGESLGRALANMMDNIGKKIIILPSSSFGQRFLFLK